MTRTTEKSRYRFGGGKFVLAFSPKRNPKDPGADKESSTDEADIVDNVNQQESREEITNTHGRDITGLEEDAKDDASLGSCGQDESFDSDDDSSCSSTSSEERDDGSHISAKLSVIRDDGTVFTYNEYEEFEVEDSLSPLDLVNFIFSGGNESFDSTETDISEVTENVPVAPSTSKWWFYHNDTASVASEKTPSGAASPASHEGGIEGNNQKQLYTESDGVDTLDHSASMEKEDEVEAVKSQDINIQEQGTLHEAPETETQKFPSVGGVVETERSETAEKDENGASGNTVGLCSWTAGFDHTPSHSKSLSKDEDEGNDSPENIRLSDGDGRRPFFWMADCGDSDRKDSEPADNGPTKDEEGSTSEENKPPSDEDNGRLFFWMSGSGDKKASEPEDINTKDDEEGSTSREKETPSSDEDNTGGLFFRMSASGGQTALDPVPVEGNAKDDDGSACREKEIPSDEGGLFPWMIGYGSVQAVPETDKENPNESPLLSDPVVEEPVVEDPVVEEDPANPVVEEERKEEYQTTNDKEASISLPLSVAETGLAENPLTDFETGKAKVKAVQQEQHTSFFGDLFSSFGVFSTSTCEHCRQPLSILDTKVEGYVGNPTAGFKTQFHFSCKQARGETEVNKKRLLQQIKLFGYLKGKQVSKTKEDRGLMKKVVTAKKIGKQETIGPTKKLPSFWKRLRQRSQMKIIPENKPQGFNSSGPSMDKLSKKKDKLAWPLARIRSASPTRKYREQSRQRGQSTSETRKHGLVSQSTNRPRPRSTKPSQSKSIRLPTYQKRVEPIKTPNESRLRKSRESQKKRSQVLDAMHGTKGGQRGIDYSGKGRSLLHQESRGATLERRVDKSNRRPTEDHRPSWDDTIPCPRQSHRQASSPGGHGAELSSRQPPPTSRASTEKRRNKRVPAVD